MPRAGLLATLLIILLLPAERVGAQTAGARSPAFAADGRLTFSAAGDIMVLAPAANGAWGTLLQVTSGPGWDRDPAWAPDGSIVFSSDRTGGSNLWRVRAEPGAEPQLLTASGERDVEPSVSAAGDVAFARGWAGDYDVWLRTEAGLERRLTNEAGSERYPVWSPAGTHLAYVAVRQSTNELRVVDLATDEEIMIAEGPQLAAPEWSPDGARLVYSLGGADGGLRVIAADGSREQFASSVDGSATWSPDGEQLVFSRLDGGDGGYNGDPDRLGERLAGDIVGASGGLSVVPAPAAVSAPTSLYLPAAPAEAARSESGAAYDRVWSRIARLYYGYDGPVTDPGSAMVAGGESDLRQWQNVGMRHRAAALEADTEAGLRDAIWAAVGKRPVAEGARGRAGVSSAHPLASAAGVEILEAGGNVVDAAVAVSFALGVVEPDASGIGGYGEMLIQLEGMEEPTAIEFMTRVPQAATLDNPAVNELPRSGPAVANVPGTVAGMEMAWRKYGSGRVKWDRILAPAIRLAEEGFVLDDGFGTTLRRERARFAEHESSRALFFRGDEPLGVGDTLRNPDLAWVLRQIAEGGAAALYSGEVGRRMVEDLRRGGNLMTVEDMSRYLAQERTPIHTTYRGNDVYSGPPPVTGGAVLAGKLNLLDLVPVGGLMTEDAGTLHRMIEAWRLQPSTGGRIADPDLWPVDITPFESKDTAAARWRCFDPLRASTTECLRGQSGAGGQSRPSGLRSAVPPRSTSPPQSTGVGSREEGTGGEACLADDRHCRGSGTTAYVVADADGNIVSVTQTLGTWGGNFYVSPGLGFLYNDKLRSYGSNPGGYNARIPYARNTTVISPTIVFRGSGADRQAWFGVGAAGNAWITAAVYTAVAGIIDHGLGAQAALELPRFLPGGAGIQIEDGFDPAVIRQLEAMGHTFNRISLMGELRMGYGAAVVIDGDGVETAGDPRRGGAGAATGVSGR